MRPEEATTWELGFEAEKDNNWLKLNYFNSKYDNLITYDKVNGKIHLSMLKMPKLMA